MTDPDSKAPEVIRNLLHQDLSYRQRGLEELKENWMIEYREYLWKAIEEEKQKSFQAELVLFALHTLRDKSLRKMIRFVEKDQLYPSATNKLLDVYPSMETNIVREALIKSLNRIPSYTYKFVLKLLNRTEIYQPFSHDNHLIEDILSPAVPDRYRREFVVRVMNNYLRSHRTFLRRLHIWNIITEDRLLHLTVLQAFYNAQHKPEFEIVKPAQQISTHLLPRKHGLVNYPNRNEPLVDWYSYPDTLEFLYNSRLSKEPEVIEEFIQIIQQVDIPPIDHDPTLDGDLDSLYQAWDPIVTSGEDLTLLEIDRIEEIQFSSLGLDETVPTPTYFHWIQDLHINPHAVIAHVLNYLPRYFLLRQSSTSDTSPTVQALEGLAHFKYWLTPPTHTKTSSNTLQVQYRGPPKFWMATIEQCCKHLLEPPTDDLRIAALSMLYIFLDILEPIPDFTNFFEKIHSYLADIASLSETSDKTDVSKHFSSIEKELDFHLTRLDDKKDNIDLILLQEYLEVFVKTAEDSVKQIQELVDHVLKAQELITAQEKEVLKLVDQLTLIADLNYWYNLVIIHVTDELQKTAKFLNKQLSHFQKYYKRLGRVSEIIRDQIKLIGDPKEVQLDDSHIITELIDLHRKLQNSFNDLQVQSTPLSLLGTGDNSISKRLHQLQSKIIYTIQIHDETTLRSDLQDYLTSILSNFPELRSTENTELLLFRLGTEKEINIQSLFEEEIQLFLSYLLQHDLQSSTLQYFDKLLGVASVDTASYILDLFDKLLRFGLVDTSGQVQTLIDIFQNSEHVKIRTRARLLST